MNFRFSFKNWLLSEATVAQYFKGTKEFPIEVVNSYRKMVSTLFPGIALNTATVNANIKARFINWICYQILKQNAATSPVPNQVEVSRLIQAYWGDVADYFLHNLNNNQLLSKLNDTFYSVEEAKKESRQWHEKLKTIKNAQGAPGKVVLTLPQGWTWVSLDKATCSVEGKAAGHCGNTGGKPGDNILSLRDPQQNVHATFIINNGILGEMKGRHNSKPSVKLHPAIIELLKSPLVKIIRGGGYQPQNNFALDDLTPEERAEIEKLKPDIDQEDIVSNPVKLGKLVETCVSTSKFFVQKSQAAAIYNFFLSDDKDPTHEQLPYGIITLEKIDFDGDNQEWHFKYDDQGASETLFKNTLLKFDYDKYVDLGLDNLPSHMAEFKPLYQQAHSKSNYLKETFRTQAIQVLTQYFSTDRQLKDMKGPWGIRVLGRDSYDNVILQSSSEDIFKELVKRWSGKPHNLSQAFNTEVDGHVKTTLLAPVGDKQIDKAIRLNIGRIMSRIAK